MNLINFKVTIRNARKNGVISFAKIFGLSISFAVILFAICYVFYETSFDKHVKDYDKIYRCLMQGHLNDENADYAVTSAAEGPSLVAEVPEITESLRMFYQGSADISANKKDYLSGSLFYSDANFFQFWNIPVKSNMQEPLATNNYVVISESMAKKMFGSVKDALDKNITFRSNECIITGVFADLPKNFHLEIDFLQSIEKEIKGNPHWGNQSYYTYIKTVSPQINIDDLNFKITKNVYTHFHDIDGSKAQSMDDFKRDDDFYLFYTAEPLTDIHFGQHKFDPAKTANKTYVYGAIVLAILILLISSINFINLSVANLSTRYKEVGIRKTIGALKTHILKQFLNETFVFFTVSLLFALFLFFIFGESLSKNLGFDITLTKENLLKIVVTSSAFLLLFMLVINLIPIWITSRSETLSLIKGNNKRSQTRGSNAFVFVQFMISVVIILSSVIMNKQINYLVNKDKGFSSENIMQISLWRLSEQQRESFIGQLNTHPSIQSVSCSMRSIGTDIGMNSAYFENMDDESNYFHPSLMPVDANFAETFGLRIKEGRFFDETRETDKHTAIINEAAAADYKKEGSLIGKKLIADGDFEIIGIVRDFNFRSLHHAVEPLVLTNAKNQGWVYLKMDMRNLSEVIKIVQNQWNEFNINAPFKYEILDDFLARNYAKDQQAKKLLLLLSLISIAIACVGLYAVSFFSIVRKTKEIGVRKVNGATISEVMTMLNINFIKGVFVAIVIATPISWFAMNKWLENFAYKTSLSWWIFALAGILALVIALLTVSWQSWRAATKNPVEALRYE